ncbi:MAG: hypothetical protein IPF98_04530 [Gemmatimonadetes bacterium]|nr:hypothetical protein [Gemmatimonadota bacterium]
MSVLALPIRRLSLSLGALLLIACGGGGDGGTTNPPAVGGFAITLSSSTLSVVQGSNTSVSASIARTGSFSGTVDLTTESVPSGITASFSPAAITSGTTSTSLTVAAASSVAPGNYTFTVRGRATGISDQTGQVTLTVTAAPAIGMTLAPSALTVVQGASGQSTVTIARTNLTTAIALSASGAPAGVTTTFALATINTETSTTLSVAVGAAVAVGTYPITVTATAGAVTQVATLQLTVDLLRTLSLSATPNPLSVTQGLAGSATVTVTRLNVTGEVTLAVSGQPTGVSVNTNPNPVSGTSATVTLNVGAAVVPGNYPITVTASAAGVANATTQFTLTVVAGAPAIALSLTRTSLSIVQGDSAGTSIVITRSNFSQQVNLAVSGVPNNVTARLSNTATLTNGAILTIVAGAGASPGTYPILVTGTGTGISPASTSLSVTITAPPAGTGNVTWAFGGCDPNDIPLWFAAQNGSGQWQQVTPNGASFSFTITSNGGVAYVTQDGANDYAVNFYWGLLGELQGRGDSACSLPATRTVNGSVANYGTSTSAFVTLGSALASLQVPTTAFTLNNVATGTVDLVAGRQGIDLLNPLAGLQLNRMIIRRGLNPANGSTLPVLDFSGAESFAPVSRTLTVSGSLQGEQLVVGVSYLTANQGFASLSQGLFSGASATFAGVPTAQQAATDLHTLNVIATSTSGMVTSARSVTSVFKEAVDRALTLGPELSVPAFTTLATTPYLRTRVQVARQAEYDQTFVLGYGQANRQVTVLMSSGYLGSSPFDFAFPDFTTVGGWQNIWGPLGSGSASFVVSVSGWTLGGGGFQNPNVDGALIRTGSRMGTYTP